MIRTDASISTKTYSNGATKPRIVLTIKAANDEWEMVGTLSFTGMSSMSIDKIEDELTRRLNGRCTLSISPSNSFDIMTSDKINVALVSFCREWGLSVEDIARKSGLNTKTIEKCMDKNENPRYHTRCAIASTIDRVSQHPSIGEYIRHRRLQAGYHSRQAATFLETDEQTLLRWERDEIEVPEKNRWVLMNMYGITDNIWDSTTPTVLDIMAPVTATSPMAWGSKSRNKAVVE